MENQGCVPSFDEEEIPIDPDELDYPYDQDICENPDKIMYINDSVQKPKNLPEPLSELIDRLQRYRREGKYLHFEAQVEGLEGLAKNYFMANAISERDLRAIFKMFGWAW